MIIRFLTWGVQWYSVFVDRSYYSQVITPIIKTRKFSYTVKHIFIPRFVMLYIEKFYLWNCSGVLQIESHMVEIIAIIVFQAH